MYRFVHLRRCGGGAVAARLRWPTSLWLPKISSGRLNRAESSLNADSFTFFTTSICGEVCVCACGCVIVCILGWFVPSLLLLLIYTFASFSSFRCWNEQSLLARCRTFATFKTFTARTIRTEPMSFARNCLKTRWILFHRSFSKHAHEYRLNFVRFVSVFDIPFHSYILLKILWRWKIRWLAKWIRIFSASHLCVCVRRIPTGWWCVGKEKGSFTILFLCFVRIGQEVANTLAQIQWNGSFSHSLIRRSYNSNIFVQQTMMMTDDVTQIHRWLQYTHRGYTVQMHNSHTRHIRGALQPRREHWIHPEFNITVIWTYSHSPHSVSTSRLWVHRRTRDKMYISKL